MMEKVLVFIFLFSTVYSFAVDEDDEFENLVDAYPEESERSLSPGAVCDKKKDDCQCYGKWHKCSCPWFWQSGDCHCEKGYKHTCITKLSCPNKGEWGLDWRSDESERSPC